MEKTPPEPSLIDRAGGLVDAIASTTQTPQGVRPVTIEEEEADAKSGGVLTWVTGVVAMPVAAVGSALSIFRHTGFRWIWTGTLVSTMGSWVQNAAKSWLVFKLTDSARWLGIDAMATWLPMLVMLPIGGVLADRLNRRVLMIAMNLTQAVAAVIVGLLIYYKYIQIWHLLLLSAVMGLTQGMLIPASQSLTPSLVPHDQLRRVVALNAVQFNVSRSLGPALSGLIVEQVGIAMCYFTNALSYLFVVIPLLFIKVPSDHLKRQKGRSFFESFTESFKYLRSRPDLIIVETVVFWIAFCSAPVMTMLPALTKRVYNGDASDYAHLLSAMGVGALCAALINAVQAKRLMTVGHALPRVLALGVVLMALGMTKIYGIALFLMFAAGLVLVGVGNLMQATVISSVPGHLHGRIAGMHVLCFSIGVPLGSFIDGFAAEQFGVERIFTAAGLLLCVGVSGLIWGYRHQKIEMDHGTPQEKMT